MEVNMENKQQILKLRYVWWKISYLDVPTYFSK